MIKSTFIRKAVCVLASFLMVFALMPEISLTAFAGDSGAISLKYGDFSFSKVSNPTSGSKKPDGINTNDITGYPANRLNSYAWAVASRGDSIYIGTNRTLFGSALNAVAEVVQQQNPNMTSEKLGKLVKLISGGEVPVNLSDEDYIPQIIRFDVANGSTEVIYQPGTALGEDGRLYYTDKDGNLIRESDVASETASFRSVVQFGDNLYFGSLGTNMLQLVRIDEKDNSDVVFQTIGSYSSLRAGCTHDAGNGETIYFGGQDVSNPAWRKYRSEHPNAKSPLPIVIRYLDPETAGTGQEDWSGLVADFSDFGEYSYATVYASGGGNVWDLCSYNGKLYLILAYDGGWAMFRGEKGGAAPNKYGWTWTEVVGNNGRYPLAMNSEVAVLNEQFRTAYGCNNYGALLTGSGLLESTATPYVYNGKMYIGSFDNATMLQAQTVTKLLKKLQALKTARETGDRGPTLEQIFAPFYQALSHPQHIWVMDENENISPADSANTLLEGTTNDYIWRFIEYDGRLYTGTFDSATAYNYFLEYTPERFKTLLKELKPELPENLKELVDGDFSEELLAALDKSEGLLPSRRAGAGEETGCTDDVSGELKTAAVNASACAEDFLSGDASVEDLLGAMTELEEAKNELDGTEESGRDGSRTLSISRDKDSNISDDVREKIDFLLDLFDVEGLKYWAAARKLIRQDVKGFDLLVTEDGENWSRILSDGLNDPYNYGARTLTVCNDELYLGTANPYYGAQLWKVSCSRIYPAKVVRKPAAISDLTYSGLPQKLVTAGTAKGGTIVYALSKKDALEPQVGWSMYVPTAINAGTYTVLWEVIGDADHKNVSGQPITVTISKSPAKIKVKTTARTYKASALKKGSKTFSIGAKADSGSKLSYSAAGYKNKASKKYLKLDTGSGKITVKKGTPKGAYSIKVKIQSRETDNYNASTLTKTIKVTVKK